MVITSMILKVLGIVTILNGIPKVGIKSLVFIFIGMTLWTLGDRLRKEY